MSRIKALAIFNALSFIAQIVFVFLAQTGVINGASTGDISAKFDTLLTPAPFTFGVWGIIYLTTAILCLYHIIMAYKHDKMNPANGELSRMGIYFIVLNISSIGWLIAWTAESMFFAMILMFVQLLSLIIIHIRLGIYKITKPAGIKVATQFPLSIYLGWISMLTIFTTTVYLKWAGWDGFGIAGYQWSIIMIAFITLLSAFVIMVRKNIYFGLIAMWAIYGIIEKRAALQADDYEALIVTSWAGIGIIGVLAILRFIKNLQYKRPREIFPSKPLPIK